MQIIAPTNVITVFYDLTYMRAYLIYVLVSKIPGPADKEDIIVREGADKSYYIFGRGCISSRT